MGDPACHHSRGNIEAPARTASLTHPAPSASDHDALYTIPGFPEAPFMDTYSETVHSMNSIRPETIKDYIISFVLGSA